MLDLNKLSSYSTGQIKGLISSLTIKQKTYRIYTILLSILSIIFATCCIVFTIFCFNQFEVDKMHIFLSLSIVSLVLFLISFSILTFFLIILIPTNKNNINALNAFLNKK